MDETIIKLQREVKLNRIHVFNCILDFFQQPASEVQERLSIFRVDVDVDCTMYWFLKKEKETAWASLFSTLWCSQSS